MIKIENTNVSGWDTAIRGMRNPLNSWDKSDTHFEYAYGALHTVKLGGNDLSLMEKLVKAGSDHRKFMRFITVSLDITAPLYWWKEFDTYKVGTVANSCSTMHKIHDKEFTMSDFSWEHLDVLSLGSLLETIKVMNHHRERYLATKDKFHWWQLIQLLPTSYNQKRTVLFNYEVLRNMYHSREFHKLDEWRDLCAFIKTLPYHELITEEC